ncbi:hypothetical protein CYMTET_18280 [Cymbomonas tetramitiformis]|uniref:Uncharacterized protein n=1 Tax=Cymbomonas tetramitiformis TaxID=36881 RepID=A0AAE0G913_9CHLO|nr:hypothetical protein CYMTET_18280 [Cymbomonas tetramitiformis]
MWNSLNKLENFGKPLTTPTNAQVNELVHYIKVKHLTDLTIMDPLAKSSDLVENFVQALNAKEKERKGKRQFKAECFKVKGTVRKGRTKKTAYFDPLLEEHADRYKRKGQTLPKWYSVILLLREARDESGLAPPKEMPRCREDEGNAVSVLERGALFLDAVKRLAKESFDERAAKLVIKKVYDDKHGRFDGTESNVSSVFARLVLALRDIFVTEESAFSSLFDLEDATLPVRAEANKLRFSTLEFIIAPVSPAADWMESSAETHPFDGKRVLLEIARLLLDSGGPFQAAPQTFWPSRRQPVRPVAGYRRLQRRSPVRSTEEHPRRHGGQVLVHQVPRPGFVYAPVVNRLLLHDQRAAESLATIQQWTRECYAQNGADSHVPPATRTFSALTLAGQSDDEDFKTIFGELRDQLFDMKKEIKALHTRIDDTKGFTPRNDKKNAIGRGGHGDGVRFAAKPLPEHGNFPQTFRGKSSGKVAFHKPTLRIADSENDVLATLFQNAMDDNNDAARFGAVCCIADGKPELYDTVSAFSFAVSEERVPDTIDEYLECRQPADTRFGVCAIGGATNINNFQVHAKVHDDAPVVPPPPAPPSAPQSVVSDEGMYPVSALHAHEPHMSFMDKFAVNLDLTGPEPTLAMHNMGTVAPVDSVSVATGRLRG